MVSVIIIRNIKSSILFPLSRARYGRDVKYFSSQGDKKLYLRIFELFSENSSFFLVLKRIEIKFKRNVCMSVCHKLTHALTAFD